MARLASIDSGKILNEPATLGGSSFPTMIPFAKWQRARDKACASLFSGESLLLLTGPAGTGKTVLLQDMSRILRFAGWHVTMRVAGVSASEDRPTTEAQAALVIDEADRLSDADLQAVSDDWSGALVLAGLDGLGSRCEAGTRLSLLPLSPAEARAYIAQWFDAAKQDPKRLEAEAVERIIGLAGGIPRILSALLGAVVWTADAAGTLMISREHVINAAALRACLIGEDVAPDVVLSPSARPKRPVTVVPPAIVTPARDAWMEPGRTELARIEPIRLEPSPTDHLPAPTLAAVPLPVVPVSVVPVPVVPVPVALVPAIPLPTVPPPAGPTSAAPTSAVPTSEAPAAVAPVAVPTEMTPTAVSPPTRARRQSLLLPAAAAIIVLGAACAVAAYREWPNEAEGAITRLRAYAERSLHLGTPAEPVRSTNYAMATSPFPTPPSMLQMTVPPVTAPPVTAPPVTAPPVTALPATRTAPAAARASAPAPAPAPSPAIAPRPEERLTAAAPAPKSAELPNVVTPAPAPASLPEEHVAAPATTPAPNPSPALQAKAPVEPQAAQPPTPPIEGVVKPAAVTTQAEPAAPTPTAASTPSAASTPPAAPTRIVPDAMPPPAAIVAQTLAPNPPAAPASTPAPTPTAASAPAPASTPTTALAPASDAPKAESPQSPSPAPVALASIAPASIAAAPITPVPPRIAPVAAPPPLAPILIETLVRRGNEMFAIGDISAARLLFDRAAQAGDAGAMVALGRTFDPLALNEPGEHLAADPAVAARWYRQAIAAGNADAASLLQRIEQHTSQ